jgi:Holliday junction resolvase RusA-like endonuclease
MTTTSITIELPFPPSTNRLWRIVRGGKVALSPEYKMWKDQAERLFVTQKRGLLAAGAKWPIIGPYRIDIVLDPGHRSDTDNCIKAVNDWLQAVEIVKNDRYCVAGSWRRGQTPHGCRVSVKAY